MKDTKPVPEEILVRTPLFLPEWLPSYYRLKEHPDAPVWNTQCGDRLSPEDKMFVQTFQEDLNRRRTSGSYPSEKILEWVLSHKNRTKVFHDHLSDIQIETQFFQIPTCGRNTLAGSLVDLVPYDEDLSRVVVYDTSGTTGHAIKVPNHPKSIGCYDPILEYVLSKHVQLPKIDHTVTACLLVCFQENTITYPALHTYWNGAGFAKINLHPKEWKTAQSRENFINDLKPLFFTGDPISFLELLKMDLTFSPLALVSTAIRVTPYLREEIQKKMGCPAIEIYSLNDTGPIAYTCPINQDIFHILPNDIFVEITDEHGNNLGENAMGEITITGGRNPYIPLLRYKTGDNAELDRTPCSCGELSPSLKNFHGRKLVMFEGENAKVVNPIDISKIIRKYPVVQHCFVQNTDRSCTLSIRIFDPKLHYGKKELLEELRALFGLSIPITIIIDQSLGESGKKVIPYIR
jgi:phenylacetate-CoA ligase